MDWAGFDFFDHYVRAGGRDFIRNDDTPDEPGDWARYMMDAITNHYGYEDAEFSGVLTPHPDEFLAAVLGVAAGAESSHRFNVFGTENGYQSGRELLHGANGGLLVYGSVLSTSSSGGSTTTESLLTFVWFDRMDWNAAYEGDDEASGIGDQIGRIPFVEPVAYDVMISWSSNVSVTHGSGPAQASGWPFDTPITCVPAGDTYLSC